MLAMVLRVICKESSRFLYEHMEFMYNDQVKVIFLFIVRKQIKEKEKPDHIRGED